MIQSSLSSSQYSRNQIQSHRKRRHGRKHSKITPKDIDKNHSDLAASIVSQVPTFSTASKVRSSFVSNNNDSFPRAITPLRRRKTISDQRISSPSRVTERSELQTPVNDDSTNSTNNDKQKQLKHTKQFGGCISVCECILRILYGILGLLLLTALILPSIFTFILIPKTSATTTTTTTLTTYRNHCASISPSSQWQINTTTVITMKINTSECNFKETPLYFVSIAGNNSHFCLTGQAAIYLPSNKSFQIYTESTCAGLPATSMLSYATLYGWHVNWMGFYK